MTTKPDNVIRLGDPESDPVAEIAKKYDMKNVPDFLLYLATSETGEKGDSRTRLVYHAAKRELRARELRARAQELRGKTIPQDLSDQVAAAILEMSESATFLHGGIDEDGCPYLQPMDEED